MVDSALHRFKTIICTAFLESLGYRILRFWNNQVLSGIKSVLKVIHDRLKYDLPSPRPSP